MCQEIDLTHKHNNLWMQYCCMDCFQNYYASRCIVILKVVIIRSSIPVWWQHLSQPIPMTNHNEIIFIGLWVSINWWNFILNRSKIKNILKAHTILALTRRFCNDLQQTKLDCRPGHTSKASQNSCTGTQSSSVAL